MMASCVVGLVALAFAPRPPEPRSGAAGSPASTRSRCHWRELSHAEHMPLSRADPEGVYPLPESPVGMSERWHAI
jgi:hypothetical protein